MKSIVDPVFGRLEMLHDIAAINMHWWAGLIVFPHAKTDVTIELHGTPIGPAEIHQHSFAKLLVKYPTLIESATDYDFELVALHNWELEKIVIFANGHIDLRLRFAGEEYSIHADENISFLTPTEAEFY
jgi:hypothetical protein